MLAIAGAKGGCGKTTTALGLAGAFARAGTPAVAVDADRQLPTLHVVAGVDRRPTLADVDDDPTAVVQDPPETPDAGVVSAPPQSDAVDLAAALGRLDGGVPQLVADCPSGAGPDAVEPVRAADRVVIVTTAEDGSVSAARTTIDVADRLGTPVAGAIVTRCDGRPDGVAAALGVPVLGAVPDRESPLTAADAREAYDDAVAALGSAAEAPADGAGPDVTERLPTGVAPLDRALDGGVPRGHVVAVTAPPASPAERLLYELSAVRGTLYLSTNRSPSLVERAIEASRAPDDRPTIRRVPADDPLAAAEALIDELPAGANLVVDAADPLERVDRSAYVDFLDALNERMIETGGVAALHCLERDGPPNCRAITERVADAVVDVRRTMGEGNWTLSVPKFRGDAAPDSIELAFDDGDDATAGDG